MSDIVRHLEFLAEMELKYATELKQLSERIKHPVLGSIFTAIANDSIKHSQIYRAVVELMTKTTPLLSEEELKYIGEAVGNHIRTESAMIEETKRLLIQIEDPRVKLLISAIHSDELTHHGVLLSIQNSIAKMEVFTEDEFWMLVWKDSPWHGAPGG